MFTNSRVNGQWSTFLRKLSFLGGSHFYGATITWLAFKPYISNLRPARIRIVYSWSRSKLSSSSTLLTYLLIFNSPLLFRRSVESVPLGWQLDRGGTRAIFPDLQIAPTFFYSKNYHQILLVLKFFVVALAYTPTAETPGVVVHEKGNWLWGGFGKGPAPRPISGWLYKWMENPKITEMNQDSQKLY